MMLKFITALICIGVSFTTFSIRKNKLLKQIKSFELVVDQDKIQAGTKIVVYLKFELFTGQILYSNAQNKIGFNDFHISIEGAEQVFSYEREAPKVRFVLANTVIEDKRKRDFLNQQNQELLLVPSFDVLKHPFLQVKIQLISVPESVYKLKLPIHFNRAFEIDFAGEPGVSGNDGADGRTRASIRTADLVVNGRSGSSGTAGENGGHGFNGKNGENLDVYVSLFHHPILQREMITVEMSPAQKESCVRYIEKTGKLHINVAGGNGGDGGNAGSGGNGAHGEAGQFVYSPRSGRIIPDEGGYGGSGGSGGNGGNGGDAGDGGNGGNVNLFFEGDAWFYKHLISINSSGGSAGEPGINGFGGYRGEGASGGKGRGNNGLHGRDGLGGYYGVDGVPGEINYFQWN